MESWAPRGELVAYWAERGLSENSWDSCTPLMAAILDFSSGGGRESIPMAIIAVLSCGARTLVAWVSARLRAAMQQGEPATFSVAARGAVDDSGAPAADSAKRQDPRFWLPHARR